MGVKEIQQRLGYTDIFTQPGVFISYDSQYERKGLPQFSKLMRDLL